MKSSVEWLEDAQNAAPEERATVADWKLLINDINVTQHLNQGVSCDHVTVALYGVAHGLAHDWWTIFGNRDRDFSLTRYRNGYLLPDIRFRFDGAAFEIEAKQLNYTDPDLRFWAGPSEVMARSDGEALLGDLIETVLARLADLGVEESGAHVRWRKVQQSMRSQDALFCEAAGGLGLDPYEVENDIADFIEQSERFFKSEALVEFVSGAAKVERSRLLDWVQNMLDDSSSQYRVKDLDPVVTETVARSQFGDGEPAWAVGYRRARAMRRTLGLSQKKAFSSFQEIAKILGAGANYNLAPRIDGIRALRSVRADGPQIHLRNHGSSAEAQTAHLFSMARALGDAACFPEDKLAPVNDLHNAYRQAAGRAFAAEFLAPIDEIRSMLGDRKDIVSMADNFAVSTSVIQHQIENANRIHAASA